MSMLLKVHTEPFQAIHFTQNARLISSNSMESQRRMALARHIALSTRSNVDAWGGDQLKNILKINHAFSSKPQDPSVSVHSLRASSPTALLSGNSVPDSGQASEISTQTTAQNSSSYAVERAALEMRTISGDLTFVPPLVLTIITQYPSISFEYTGDYNLFPAPEDMNT